MDVNVELIGFEYSRKSKLIRSGALLFNVIAFIPIFIEIPFDKYLIITFLAIGGGFILWSLAQRYPNLGKLTFTESGLTIYQGNNSQLYTLEQLKDSEFLLFEYSGKSAPAFTLTDYFKTMNYAKLPTEDGFQKFKFRVISHEHLKRLVNIVDSWSETNPRNEIYGNWQGKWIANKQNPRSTM